MLSNPPGGFVIFGSGRSGSTLLVDLLQQLPDLHCEGEILRSRKPFPLVYIRGRAAGFDKLYGFKLLQYHLQDIQRVDEGNFLQGLHRAGFRIVHLHRANVARIALSHLYAKHLGSYHLRGEVGRARMQVDLDVLARDMKSYGRRLAAVQEALGDLPRLQIVYERDLVDPVRHQATVDRIADFLGVRTVPVVTDLMRSTSKDLADFIENHQEVRALVGDV